MTKPIATWKKGLLFGLILIVAGALIYIGYRERVQWKKDHILVELKPIQTPKGWGYDILANGHVYIHQPMIPAIQGSFPFRTKEDALAVGQKVVDRIKEGKMPMVTAQEVVDLGVAPVSVAAQK
jgi:Domain of unknown function (DUF4907)